MSNMWKVLIVVVAFSMVCAAGCAKKGVEPIEEVTPPEPQVTQPVVPEPQPVMPQVEQEVTQAVIPSLEEEITAFELRDIYFDFDKFNLKPEAKLVLSEKAAFLNAHPEISIRIEGHCDERGTAEYNLALGDRRAKSALDYLVFLGINPTRVSSISYGEERPVDPGHNEEAWSKNRRVHFDVQGI